MLCSFFCQAKGYNFLPFLKGDWDLQIYETDQDKSINQPTYYHFEFEEIEKKLLQATLYPNEYPPWEDNITESNEPLGVIQINLTGDEEGYLKFTQPEEYKLCDFKFDLPDNEYFVASGIFNESYSYYISLVNMAMYHADLISLQDKTIYEVIITRRRRPVNEPWYYKYSNVVTVVITFLVCFAFLDICGPKLTETINQKTRAIEENEKKKNQTAPKKTKKE